MLSPGIDYRKSLRPLTQEILKDSRLGTFGLGCEEEIVGTLPWMIIRNGTRGDTSAAP